MCWYVSSHICFSSVSKDHWWEVGISESVTGLGPVSKAKPSASESYLSNTFFPKKQITSRKRWQVPSLCHTSLTSLRHFFPLSSFSIMLGVCQQGLLSYVQKLWLEEETQPTTQHSAAKKKKRKKKMSIRNRKLRRLFVAWLIYPSYVLLFSSQNLHGTKNSLKKNTSLQRKEIMIVHFKYCNIREDRILFAPFLREIKSWLKEGRFWLKVRNIFLMLQVIQS